MNRISQLLKDNGVSYRELAEIVDIDKSSLNKMAKSVRVIRNNHIDILSSFFDVTSDYLLGNSDTGIVVYEEKGDRAFEISEQCYNDLKDKITTTIISIKNPFVFNLIVTGERKSIIQVEKCVYREIRGSFEDYSNKEIITKCIEDYINKLDTEKARLLLQLAKGMM